jgi:hypothetical protein
MTVDATLLSSCVEVIVDPAWWYFQVVDFYAEAFWLAGGGDLIIATIEAVCLAHEVPALGERLGRQLAGVYLASHDQYRLVVSLGASGLWYRDRGPHLLEALRALTTSGDAQ